MKYAVRFEALIWPRLRAEISSSGYVIAKSIRLIQHHRIMKGLDNSKDWEDEVIHVPITY